MSVIFKQLFGKLGFYAFSFFFAFIFSSVQSEDFYHDGWTDFNKNGIKDVYEDSTKPTQERIDNLLSQMTMEEKTMQLVTLYGYDKVLKDKYPTEKWENEIWKDGLANIDEHHNGTGDAKDQDTFPFTIHLKMKNDTQRWFIENTRLGIPVDFTNEGIRGICHSNATILPSQLAVGNTWDRNLVYEVGKVTGKEAHLLGYTNVYSPILDVPRDPRWGRTIECYSESPFIIAELGIQQSKGLQSEKVGATSKHFAVYGIPIGAREGLCRVDPKTGPREMEMMHLYTFERVIKEAGLQGVMSSYNDWDGDPISGSSLFLTEILRKRMGFTGYVVSDSDAVEYLNAKHHVEPDYKGAVRRFIESGGNVRTTFNPPINFIKPLRELITEGTISMDVINSRVSDVLRFKFNMGLFDDPYRDPEQAEMLVGCGLHKSVALRAARESIVLLKNQNKILPLDRTKIKKILLTGPNANTEEICYSRYGPSKGNVITVFEGLKSLVGEKIEIVYKKGCDYHEATWPRTEIMYTEPTEEEKAGVEEAVQAAKDVDVIIASIGESRDMVGENKSRTTLDLPPLQEYLIRQLHSTGKPVVVLLHTGRPASINWIDEYCPAVIEAWFGGEYMGKAAAEVLFGEYNPGGKLTVTFPRTAGQIPFSFPFKPGSYGGEPPIDDRGTGKTSIIGELYPFGYGLSYTEFKYDNFKVTPLSLTADDKIKIECTIKNTGVYTGDEIVQLYFSDKVSDVTVYEKDIRGFERVHLEAGETKKVEFELNPKKDFWLIDRNRNRVVEPGDFDIMIGASSKDIKFTQTVKVTGETTIIEPAFWRYGK